MSDFMTQIGNLAERIHERTGRPPEKFKVLMHPADHCLATQEVVGSGVLGRGRAFPAGGRLRLNLPHCEADIIPLPVIAERRATMLWRTLDDLICVLHWYLDEGFPPELPNGIPELTTWNLGTFGDHLEAVQKVEDYSRRHSLDPMKLTIPSAPPPPGRRDKDASDSDFAKRMAMRRTGQPPVRTVGYLLPPPMPGITGDVWLLSCTMALGLGDTMADMYRHKELVEMVMR